MGSRIRQVGVRRRRFLEIARVSSGFMREARKQTDRKAHKGGSIVQGIERKFLNLNPVRVWVEPLHELTKAHCQEFTFPRNNRATFFRAFISPRNPIQSNRCISSFGIRLQILQRREHISDTYADSPSLRPIGNRIAPAPRHRLRVTIKAGVSEDGGSRTRRPAILAHTPFGKIGIGINTSTATPERNRTARSPRRNN